MKTILLCLLTCGFSLNAEFNVGAGFSFNTIDEKFSSNLSSNEDRSGRDRYDTSANRLAPYVQIGYQTCFCEDWMAGASFQYHYLNYKTENVSSSRGQILPNATLSSINFFGPEVIRDFTSKTRLDNDFRLIGLVGKALWSGFAYLGIGPTLMTGSNSIYLTSIHVPNGTGDHLTSGSATSHKIIWGGALELGYQLFLDSCSFIDFHYTYLQTGNCRFHNTVNAAQFNGFETAGPTTLFLKRTLKFKIQDFTCSFNLLY